MKRYDLNLLLALDALLRERSVSGAAGRMGIGQPAMSAALGRLRVLFDDPVLIRGPNGMEPTARVRALAAPLRDALADLSAMIEPIRPFDPATAGRTFRVSGGDYVGMTVLPGLAARLSGTATDLRFRYLEKDAALAALDDDAIDLALLVMDDLPARFGSETLIEETFVGAARLGHPILKGPLCPARFAACDHLLVTERADATGCVDACLAEQGLSRRIAITVPSSSLVADILRGTDLVATVPRRAGERMAASGLVALFDPPIPTPGWRMRAVWAARNGSDPALLWLREEMLAVPEGL